MYRLLHNSRLKSEVKSQTQQREMSYPSVCLHVRFVLENKNEFEKESKAKEEGRIMNESVVETSSSGVH